jgi:CheY-like chemotaxis protein
MKILIVDDELVSRKKMDLLVRNLGYETVVANDGSGGLGGLEKREAQNGHYGLDDAPYGWIGALQKDKRG